MQALPSEHVPIRTVSALTGVNSITLRAWERRYGLVRPLRTAKGHRLYTHEHVELIRRVVALLERGIPVSQAREVVEREARAASATVETGPWRDFRDRMLAAIARFDEPELDLVYEEALSIHPVDTVTRRVLLPLLAVVGERWLTMPGGIAEEHFLATYLRSKLGARLQHSRRQASGPRVLVACWPGEHHEIGMLLFAIEANASGLQTLVLGSDTPMTEIAIAQQRSRCDAVVISSSIDPAREVIDRQLAGLVRELTVPVFVGGGTAIRQRAAITAAGAVPLGRELEDGARLVASHLARNKETP